MADVDLLSYSANCKITDKRLVNCQIAAKRWALLAVVGSRFDRPPASSDGLGELCRTTIDF